MLIESKIKIGHDSMFNIHQTNFKSAHLLNKMALVQFQRNSTVFSDGQLAYQYYQGTHYEFWFSNNTDPFI